MNQAFDEQELTEELDGDLEFLAESLEILDEDSVTLIAQLRQAYEANDAETVAVTAHTLKSMVGNFSAEPAFEAAFAVEKLGRAGNLESCAQAIDELDSQTGRLREALHEFLRSAGG